VKSKRIELFLEAAARIDPAERRGAAFVIAGDGPERVALEREARRLGIGEGVFFTGVIPHDDIVRLLKACDVFVGTNELTNMSLPPCEAILCGVPVVAFDVSGTSEVVRDGETGLLVAEGDTAALAESMARLIRDRALRQRLGARAASFGREHFVSWENRMAMELDILRGLTANASPS
jgi:colanic acid/amylovoran biosynthesis glycosyltransferase